VRYQNIDALFFDELYVQTFNEEESIKRNELRSNINRDSALIAGKIKRKSLKLIKVSKTRAKQKIKILNVKNVESIK
jgi:hypothetical protein